MIQKLLLFFILKTFLNATIKKCIKQDKSFCYLVSSSILFEKCFDLCHASSLTTGNYESFHQVFRFCSNARPPGHIPVSNSHPRGHESWSNAKGLPGGMLSFDLIDALQPVNICCIIYRLMN